MVNAASASLIKKMTTGLTSVVGKKDIRTICTCLKYLEIRDEENPEAIQVMVLYSWNVVKEGSTEI